LTQSHLDPLSDMLDPADLRLHSKELEPLSADAIAELSRIERLSKLDGYSEMDVREEIITPILRAMGYSKETMFSMKREKYLRILEKGLSADYSVTLYEEDFWVIEAKKPSITEGVFAYPQLWQAVQYAIHPEINAALVVLCDGHAIEIFDREASLAAPILRVERENLVRDFDKIRIILGPLQAWFFQKRRIVRLVDKVFDKEFQLGRMEEFRHLIDRRLTAKQQRIIENQRIVSAERNDEGADIERIKGAAPEGVIAGFYHALSFRLIQASAESLISSGNPTAFPILLRLFPDKPGASNDSFNSSALFYLMSLEVEQDDLPWVPHWLGKGTGSGAPSASAVRKLIRLSLTHFAEDPARKAVLLYANSVRRLLKAMIILSPRLQRSGEEWHALERYRYNEFSFAQAVSSPDRHLLIKLDTLEILSVVRFVLLMQSKNGPFKLESAKLELRQLWERERSLLATVPDYPGLLRERGLGELHPTEASGMRYDNLGHGALAMIDKFPRWRAYVLQSHRPELETLASLGSWQAREYLGLDVRDVTLADNQVFADRFFWGDLSTAIALRNAYGYR